MKARGCVKSLEPSSHSLAHPSCLLSSFPQNIMSDGAKLKSFIEEHPEILRQIIASQPSLRPLIQRQVGPSVRLPE